MAGLPSNLREFDDTDKTRELIYSNCLDAVSKRFPVEDDEYRLELSNVRYDGPKDYSLGQQKQALLKSRNLRTTMKGTWRLIHKPTNTVLDERDDTVLQVPYYTNRGTFINNGNDYSIITQMRLRPGVYARRKRTGELETHFNIKPGTGRAFRFNLNPSTGEFQLTVGQSHVPLYPILKGMGVSDQDMIKAWGADVAAANSARTDAQALQKTYRRMAGAKADLNASPLAMGQYIKDAVEKYQVDPEIVLRTMGVDTDHITPELLLRASQKLLDINRGDAKPDNRDDPRYTQVYSVEDLLAERITKDAGRLTKGLLWKAKRDGSLRRIPKNALTPYLESFINGSGLTMPGEEANPLSNLEQMSRITRFGEGGIRSADSVTDEAHDVNGDWLGFVDGIAGPEGSKIGVDVRASYRTFKGNDHKLYGEFINARNGKTEYIDIGTAADHVIAFPGEDLRKPTVYAMRNDVPTRVKSSEVDYIVPSFAHMNGSNMNMNPMPTAVQTSRQFYGSKFWAQYLPQAKGEVPLVDSLMPDGKQTFSEYYGKRIGTISSKVDGTVVAVSDDSITVKDALGDKHKVDLVQSLPFNRLSAISYTPAVQVGQDVHVGDMLANSNFTDAKTGAINMGQNLKVAIIPYMGKSVSGDTNVLWEKGGKVTFGPISQVRTGNGMASIATDPATNDTEWQTCNAWMIHTPDSPMVEVGLANGTSVKVTTSHSLMVWRNGRLFQAKASEITYGDKLPFGRPDMVFGFDDSIVCHGRNYHKYELRLDHDLGFIMGMYLARGQIDCKRDFPRRIYVICDMEQAKEVMDACLRVGLKKVRFRARLRPCGVVISCAPLAQWFHDNLGVRPWEKHIPDVAWTGPEEFMAGILDGCAFSTGRVTDKLAFTVTSRVLAEGLGLYLSSLGCRHGYEKTYAHTGTYLRYKLSIEAGCFHRLPGLRFQEDMDKARQETYDIVPEDIWTSEVTSIENIPSEPYVYDLDMQPYGTFLVADGLIVHNSFEDAHVISESAAKKLATDRLYSTQIETRNGVEANKAKYMAAFPQKFTKAQFETLDEDGLAKVGTELHKGDPIAVAVGPKVLSSSDVQLGKLSKTLRNALTDRAEVWEHDWPGVVVDTAVTQSGARVNVKTTPPVTIGDKLCYAEDTDVLTWDGWKNISQLTLDDKVATLNPEDHHFEYLHPEMLQKYAHSDRMYHIASQQIDLLVTDNHNMYVAPRDHGFGFHAAKDIFGKRVSYKKDGIWDGVEPETITIPGCYVGHRWGEVYRPDIVLKAETYLMILGMFLSEGNTVAHEASGTYGIDICQQKPAGVKAAMEAFAAAGLDVKYVKSNGKWRFNGKVWYNHFSQFGKSYEKYLPRFVFSLSPRLQKILLKWLVWGDGHCEDGKMVCYTTTSVQLADDIQQLCLHCGIAANIVHGRVSAGSSSSISERGNSRTIPHLHDVHDVRFVLTKLTPTVNHGHVKKQHTQTERYEDYSGHVYCCTMPKWHAIYVRRNGKACWCGNSPRFGLKGVVGSILSDEEMPRDAATNEPYDMLVNPMGFLSRVAPGQIMEIALGKIAKARGQQIRIPQLPPPEGWAAWTQRQMDEAGLKDSADVFDPKTGKTIRNVGDGYMYVSAFHHLAEKKASARGAESAYTQDEQPAKGGSEGSKRISGLDLYALLAHGATDVIKDTITVRGTRNEDYWNALRLGLPIPEPGVPFVYDKFLNTLKAGGINVVEKGNITQILPLTDKDIDKLAGSRLLTSSEMVDSDFFPVKGGLFDEGKTGGLSGNFWSAIPLPEPVPNPIMEEPIRRVLGLTVKQMEAILSGAEKLNGKTGGEALKDALEHIDVDARIAQARQDIRNRRGSQRDNAIKVLRYLTSMKEQELKPADWMLSKVPVIPPKFRPVSKMGDVALVSDLNDLYKEVIENAKLFKELHKDLPDSATTDERLNLYMSVKAAYGLGESITPEGQAKGLKGAIRQVIGPIPKWGQFQRKVISKTVDTVSRGVVTPDPNLDMDQVGLPEDFAWTMYKPFVLRALVRRGYPPVTAIQMLEKRDPTARQMLEQEMGKRPVMMDRAPTWHKFNILAFIPHIVDDKTVHVCPLVTSGFNMDHDGDTVNIHIPVSTKAVDNAMNKMLPSKNLISLTDLTSARHPVSKEQILGLFNLTQPANGKPVQVFRSVAEAKRAYAEGRIGMNDPIEIVG